MKKNIHYIFFTIAMTVTSCSDFINMEPQGILSDSQLNNPESIEALVISAYAFMANDHYTVPNQLWPYGDLRAGDAYKGGDGPADIAIFHAMEVFYTLLPDMRFYAPSALGDINSKKWERQYVGISRVHNAMRRVKQI